MKKYMLDDLASIKITASELVPKGCILVMNGRDVVQVITLDTEETNMLVRLEVEIHVDAPTTNLLPNALHTPNGASLNLTQCDKALVVSAWKLPEDFRIVKILKVGEAGGGTLSLKASDVEAVR